MNTAANNTEAQAPKKQPTWMSLATMDELNAYIKRSKMGNIRGDEIRTQWTTAHASTDKPLNGYEGDVSTNGPSTPVESKPTAPVEDKPVSGEQQKDAAFFTKHVADGIARQTLAGSQQPVASKSLETFVQKGQNAQDAVNEVIAKAQGKRVKIEEPAATPAPAAAPVAAAPGLTTRYIDPTLVDVRDGWNARFDFGDLEQLGNQILEQKRLDGHGLLNDIRVKELPNGRYELVDGERRWQAVMGLMEKGHEWEFGIPMKVEPADSTDRELLIKMFTANQGKPLLPYEQGMYFKRLRDSGMTMAEMEKETGISDSTIWYGLALVEADEDLVEAVVKGTVGNTIAKTIAVNARGNKALQKALTAKAKEVKKTGNKTKLAELKKEIDEARRVKAAKERPGLTIKPRKASETEIAQMGQQVGARLKEVMEMLGLAFDTDMVEWVSNDRELQVAANFGALQVLKKIMGVDVKVTF